MRETKGLWISPPRFAAPSNPVSYFFIFSCRSSISCVINLILRRLCVYCSVIPETMKFVYVSYYWARRRRDKSISKRDSLSKMPDSSQSSGLALQISLSILRPGTTSSLISSARIIFSIRSKKGSQISLSTNDVSPYQSSLLKKCMYCFYLSSLNLLAWSSLTAWVSAFNKFDTFALTWVS